MVDSICVDSSDFRVDPVNNRLKLKPTYYQTPANNFVRTLSGTAGIYEQVTELPGLVIPTAGIYLIGWSGCGNATNTAASPGNIVSTSCACAVYQNGVLIPDTETRMMLNSQGTSTVDQPSLQLHGTGSGQQIIQCAAGDTLTLWAQRNSDPGTTTQILSSSGGRSRITATRIGSV